MKRIILALVLCVSWVSSNDASIEIDDSTPSQVEREKVPSLALIYDLENFPGQVEAYCETGDNNDTVVLQNQRADLDIPVLKNTGKSRMDIAWEKGDIPANRKARGLSCSVASDQNNTYEVMVPLLDKDSKYVPRRLTATINAKEDLRVSFREGTSRILEVMWQKEPVETVKKFWSVAKISESYEMVIDSKNLKEQGFYSFIRSTGESKPGKDKKPYGTLVVIIRQCPRDMYGGDKCLEQCPECMYGGICHHITGKCVCPPGRIGDHCENSCNSTSPTKVLIGPKCKIEIDPLKKLICLPNPYGCSCAPGKSGLNCTDECSEGNWGVDCKYSCNHCKSLKCDVVTGRCESREDQEPCAGGPLGLPRLRSKPTITEVRGDPLKRTVTFKRWSNSTEHGELPEGANIMGYKVILTGNDVEFTRDETGQLTTITLSRLNRGDYKVAVLVDVQLENGINCTDDGSYRGTIIQKESFSITCPQKNLPPSVVTYESSETELSLAWEDSLCDSKKEMVYRLNLSSSDLATVQQERTSNKSFTFTGLHPKQMHNVTFQSCLKDGSNCSDPITIGLFTDSAAPTEVLESSGPTVKIRLPTVLHPPACQYVVVVESKGDLDDETVKKKSLDVVTTYSDEHPNTCADVGYGHQRTDAYKDGPDEIVAYIAGALKVQNDTDNDFEIGNGKDNNKPLEEGKDYKVAVVTETKSGDIKTFAVSKPVNPRKAAAAGISGFIFGALFFVLLIFLFVWTNRVRKTRRREITQTEQNTQQDDVSLDILGLEASSSGAQPPKEGQK